MSHIWAVLFVCATKCSSATIIASSRDVRMAAWIGVVSNYFVGLDRESRDRYLGKLKGL